MEFRETIKEELEEVEKLLLKGFNFCEQMFNKLYKQGEIIMGTQADLDADVQKINDAVTLIKQEIVDLKNQPGAASLDLTSLESAVGGLEGLETPVTPADPSPPPVV